MPYFSLKFKAAAIIPALLIIFFCSSAYAQTTPAAETAKPQAATGVTVLIDKFFKTYKEDTRKAVIDLFKTNPLIDSSKLTDLIDKINKEREPMGKYAGKELISQKKASNSLVLYSYLVKHELQPVRFTFMFYKPKNEWIIYRFYFDGNVETELQNSAKL
ncbi:MAG: hypothetical protein EOP47_22020 [Sphingobacteriaceae bacterium]|nr:MAG: hypothetical protein EOP47_22020 [Sphingobacteriaceae bacterium]